MRFRRSHQAVSSVVAAALIFSLISTVLVLWTFNQMPDIIAGREEAHQKDVQERLAGLQAGIDQLSSVDATGPVRTTFQLGAPPIPLLQRAPASGTVYYEEGFSLGGSFTSPVVYLRDGGMVGVPDAAVDGTSIAGLGDVTGLRVSMDSSGINGNDVAFVQFEATDGTDTVTARLEHLGSNAAEACSGNEVRLVITSAGVDTVQPLLCSAGSDLDGFVVDLLEADAGLAEAMATLQTPFTVTLTDGATGGSADASYQIAYRTDAGAVQAAGGGTPGYALSQDGGRVVFDPQNQGFLDQQVVLEGGAVLVLQGDGSGHITEPSLRVDEQGTTGHVSFGTTLLSGEGSTGGTGTATVSAVHHRTRDVVLEASGGTITITSEYAQAWRGFFMDAIEAAGTEHISVGGAGDTATLSLEDDVITSWFVHLRIIEADVRIL